MVGLEPSVAVLHEFADYQTRQWLVYDLEETFRWIADVTVMDAFESGVLHLPDFYFTGDDYRYRFEPEAKRRFLELLRERFNSGITYRERALKWDTVIEQKTGELGRYLVGRTGEPVFSEPMPSLHRDDDRELRATIPALTSVQAKQLDVGKSTFHHVRRHARSDRSFRTYAKLRHKLRRVAIGATRPS